MFAKSAFVVRSLFVAAVFGSLVACTFDGSTTGEDKGDTSSALDGKKASKKSSADAGETGEDGGVYDSDAGFSDNDASCTHCDQDAGPFDGDGGVSDSDGGWWGGDDDDDSSNDGGSYDDRDAGF